MSAVQYLERFFELARSVGDRAMLDKVRDPTELGVSPGWWVDWSILFSRFASAQARTYLGIARGNSVLPAYTQVVTSDLDALLRWKNRRVPFTDALRAAH